MEIQEIKDKFRITQGRYLICKYDKSYPSNEFVQVVLKVISDEADFVNYINSTQNVFEDNSKSNVCYVKAEYFNDFIDENLYLTSFNDESYDNQISYLNEFLKDKLIVVKPYFYYNENRNLFFKNGTVVDVIQMSKEPSDNLSYKSIPMIRNANVYSKLIKREDFPLQSVSREIMGVPEYICYGEKILKVKLEALESNDCYWHVVNDDNPIEELDLDFEALVKSNDIIINDESEFVFVNYDNLLLSKVKKQEEIAGDIKELTSTEIDESYGGSDKDKMINEFYNYTKSCNLCYSIDDINNFYTCVSSSQLIILAGMSGTGKTKLPLKFADYFNMNEENGKLLFLPVSPSFTEPSDVLGYLNPTTGIYNPSETRLVDFLKHAEEYNDEMHMVIFDEMNLSQIEFWFAPFISILEKDIEDRKLFLYGEYQRCINCEKYPSSIKIGNNIIFVGTINLDETTKNISDRLIDRSYIISLKKLKFSEYFAQQSGKSENEINKIKNSSKDFMEYMPTESMNDKNYITNFSIKQLEFFDRIHEELNKIDSQKGVSFRAVKNIALYMKNRPNDFDEKKAFDYAFKQTIMKKINGTIDNIGEFLGYSDVSEEQTGVLIDIFNEYCELSDFKECRNEIKNKIMELRKYGYAK